jgi:hypothetical protein
MPRQARLDAAGTLHHVIIRGIERRRILDDNQDRREFVSRLGERARRAHPLMRIISLIDQPDVFKKILQHLGLWEEYHGPLKDILR